MKNCGLFQPKWSRCYLNSRPPRKKHSPRGRSSPTVASTCFTKVKRPSTLAAPIRYGNELGPMGETAQPTIRLLAKEYNLDIGHSAPANRSQIAEGYAAEFREQKQRVRSMMIRAVAITDDTASYFFEAYAVLALGTTEFNKFEPH